MMIRKNWYDIHTHSIYICIIWYINIFNCDINYFIWNIRIFKCDIFCFIWNIYYFSCILFYFICDILYFIWYMLNSDIFNISVSILYISDGILHTSSIIFILQMIFSKLHLLISILQIIFSKLHLLFSTLL